MSCFQESQFLGKLKQDTKLSLLNHHLSSHLASGKSVLPMKVANTRVDSLIACYPVKAMRSVCVCVFLLAFLSHHKFINFFDWLEIRHREDGIIIIINIRIDLYVMLRLEGKNTFIFSFTYTIYDSFNCLSVFFTWTLGAESTQMVPS